MALITCDECGHRISDKSIFCPSCGYPTHLNKALREPRDNNGVPTSTKNAKLDVSPKSEMSDEAVKAALLSSQTPVTPEPPQPCGSETTAAKATSDDDTVRADAAPQETAPTANIEYKNTDDVQDALAEYEATLSKPITPETNKRNKLILYFAVLLALLIAIGGCYYYAKSNHLQSVDEVECEPIEEVLEEEPAIIAPDDTAAVIADTLNLPEPIGQQTSANTSSSSVAPKVSDTPAQPVAPQVEASPAVRQL